MYQYNNSDFNPNEYTYIHSYGFAPKNPYNTEVSLIKSYSNALGFAIIFMYFLQLTIPKFIYGFLSTISSFLANYSFGSYAISVIYNLADGISYVVCLVLPFFLYMKFIGIPLSTAIPLKKPKANIAIPAVSMALGVSVLGTMTTVAISIALSLFNVYISSPQFTPPQGIIAFLIYVLNVVILPAFVEEGVFRGVVLQSLRRFGDGFAIIASAILFGIVHGNLVQAPNAFLVGLVMALFVVVTGSLWTGIIIHLINNGIAVISTTLSPHMSTDSSIILVYSIYAVYIILGILGLLYLAKNNENILKIKPSGSYISEKGKYKYFFFTIAMLSAIFMIASISMQYIHFIM